MRRGLQLNGRKELIMTLIGVFGLALIIVKLGNVVGWNLLWLYAVAGVIDVAILGEYFYHRRRDASGVTDSQT
jgi:hypothetical protein